MGQYLGLVISLSLSFSLGIALGLVFSGLGISGGFGMLLLSGNLLTMIFTGLAFLISIGTDNRIKGFGIAILTWLFFAVIYDGIFLLSLVFLKDYPLETFTLSATMFNPIDLSRIMVILDLDISALMGYSGAVYSRFFGTSSGIIVSILTLVFWAVTPVSLFLYAAGKKDF